MYVIPRFYMAANATALLYHLNSGVYMGGRVGVTETPKFLDIDGDTGNSWLIY